MFWTCCWNGSSWRNGSGVDVPEHLSCCLYAPVLRLLCVTVSSSLERASEPKRGVQVNQFQLLANDLCVLYRLLHVFLAVLQKLRMMFFCMKHYMFYYVVLPPRRLHNPSALGAGHHLHLTFTHRITSIQNYNQSARTGLVVEEKKRGKVSLL